MAGHTDEKTISRLVGDVGVLSHVANPPRPREAAGAAFCRDYLVRVVLRELMQMLREHRLQSPPGDDDVLIRRLQVP